MFESKYWSSCFVDPESRLLKIIFNKNDFTLEEIRNTINIIKTSFNYVAKTMQLVGIQLNGMKTMNPLVSDKTIVTPSYQLIYNLNKMTFYSENMLKDDELLNASIEFNNYNIKFKELQERLKQLHILANISDNSEQIVLSKLDNETLVTLDLCFMSINRTTTDDYVKYKLSKPLFIYTGLLKKLDLKFSYFEDKIEISFNMPIINSTETINYLIEQLDVMSSLVNI